MGNDLYADCSGPAGTAASAACNSYILGVSDVLYVQNTNSMCLPKGVVTGQIIDVVRKYLTDHPETRHYTAVSEITVALQSAFPCKLR
jgi:Rap1a immunity proteins